MPRLFFKGFYHADGLNITCAISRVCHYRTGIPKTELEKFKQHPFEPGLGAFFLVGMKFRPEKRSVFVGVGRWVNPSRESGLAVDPVGDFPVAGCFSAQYPA